MAQLDIDDSVAFEILRQLRAGKWLCPDNDAIAAYVLRTPVDKLTVEQYEFARRMAGMSTKPYSTLTQINDDHKMLTRINQEQRIEKQYKSAGKVLGKY